MKPRDLLRMEAELQRQTLRTEMGALRRRPSTLLKDIAGGGAVAGALTRVLPRVLGRRAPWVVYGWLAYKAWRVLFPSPARSLPRTRRFHLPRR